MYHGNLAATFAYFALWQRASRLIWNLRASNMDSKRYGAIVRWNARLSRLPDVIIANSQAGAEFHIAQGFHASCLKVIPNGIDIDRFRPNPEKALETRADHDIPISAVLAIHVARVDPMKGHAVFLAAMEEVPNVHAILIGAGTENLVLPPNVQALGARADVDRLYAAANIVVSTSCFGEGFPNVVAEGMSAGLVPIATDVGDAKDIIGDVGTIVPAGDVRALIVALENCASLSKESRSGRGVAARKRILDHFSITKAVDAFERVLITQ
jgi:glycosyltransferase involved in cell wall biosynthesis